MLEDSEGHGEELLRQFEDEARQAYVEILQFLIKSTHPEKDSVGPGRTTEALFKLIQAHRGLQVFDGDEAKARSPLSWPGVRSLLRHLIDLAKFSSGSNPELCELDELLSDIPTD